MFNLFNLAQPKSVIGKIKPTALIILDGWGVAPASAGNAITQAKTPNMDKLFATYPHTELLAAGESVGLPANEVGNTEVGHLNLGAGRLILQDLKKISQSIKEGDFFYNKALKAAAEHVRKSNSKFHLIGLVGSGHVHSSLDHLYGLIDFAKKEGLSRTFLHIFTDGRDSPPQEGITIVAQLENYLKSVSCGAIATIAGRYWGMDRDRRWDRTQKAYDAITAGQGVMAASASQAIQSSYAAGKSDEFIEPSVVSIGGRPLATIDDNDAAVFFNFRIDRPRQLTLAFVLPDFENLKALDLGSDPEKGGRLGGAVKVDKTFARIKKPQNLFFATMTEYQKGLPVSAILFPPEVVPNSLPVVVANSNLRQLHLSESEKERFITYYFNGLREERLPGEDVTIVPSQKVATYDKKPEMSAPGIVREFKNALNRDLYHFLVVNLANPDMVAHTGNLKATIEACQHADQAVGEIINEILARGGNALISADHGNAEELLSFSATSFFFTTAQGQVNTDHSNYPVPLIIVSPALQGKAVNLPKGSLADVAPTTLSLMGLPIPAEMTGQNLLKSIS